MRAGIFAMQGLREILVNAITSRLAESIDKKWICLTCVPGYAASKVVAAAVLAMLLAACVSGVKRSDEHETGWRDDPLQASKRQRELMLQSNWRGKPYKALTEAFGEPVWQLNIPGRPPLKTFSVVYDARDKAGNCIDAFTLLKVEDSREWVVDNYSCR